MVDNPDEKPEDEKDEVLTDETDGEPDVVDTEDAEEDQGDDTPLDDEESDPKTAPVEAVESTEPPSPPEGIDWSHLGPRLWNALHGLLSGNKTKHDDKYVIEASHEAVGEAHDTLAQ